MKSVEDSFAHFQQTAKTLDTSLSVAFLDLESFVLGFPWILAVGLSTVILATTHRLRHVRIIHRLISQSAPQAESWKQALGLVGLESHSLRRSSIAMGAVGAVWITVVFAQLYSHVEWTSRDVLTMVLTLGLVISVCVIRFKLLSEVSLSEVSLSSRLSTDE